MKTASGVGPALTAEEWAEVLPGSDNPHRGHVGAEGYLTVHFGFTADTLQLSKPSTTSTLLRGM